MKILIVDDNAEDRYLLKLNMVHHGCEVIEAANGAEGLHLASSDRPDLIVSDALMPVMDGFQFLRCIKTDESLRSIPFIFYSAVYTGNKEAELAISLGAEAFIVKPKDAQEFWDELSTILTRCTLKKESVVRTELGHEEEDFLRKYSHIVAEKLEEKVRILEAARANIAEKEQEWQETFDAIGDCVTIHDLNNNVLLANKACRNVLGVSPDEIHSRKCFELFHKTRGPVGTCPMFSTVQTGASSEIELFEPSLNTWLSISCFPLSGKDGAVRGVVHFAKDITLRKKMEKDLSEQRSQPSLYFRTGGGRHCPRELGRALVEG